MEEKARFRAVIAVAIAVLGGGALYIFAAANLRAEIGWTLVTIAILVGMAFVAVAVVVKERRDLNRGFPKEDERSRAIRMHAGYLAFYISLYFLLGMSMVQVLLEDHQVLLLPTAEWGMIYVAIMGSTFLAVHAYLGRKGVP